MDDKIERLVLEAEKFADQDTAKKQNVEARNGLEAYLYSLDSDRGKVIKP